MKLHLGCGARNLPGFTHVDVQDFPHVTIRHEVDSLPMIGDNTIELIYACHVLEHFLRREVPRVLREWHRILKPGGVLRLSVPDFAAICEIYRCSKELSSVIGPLFGRQNHLYNFHHTVFDERDLRRFLLDAGFISTRLYDWRKTDHAHIDDYSQAYWPHMSKETGIQLSLNIEGVK